MVFRLLMRDASCHAPRSYENAQNEVKAHHKAMHEYNEAKVGFYLNTVHSPSLIDHDIQDACQVSMCFLRPPR